MSRHPVEAVDSILRITITGVTVLRKMRPLIDAGLWFGSLLGALAWAQEGFNHYPYQPSRPSSGDYSGYQWRPVEGKNTYKSEGIRSFRGGAEILPSQSYPVMTLPPGTYRPIEDLNRIPPQVEGYRFRTVSPDEQSGNKKQERMRNKEKPAPTQSQFRYRGSVPSAEMWRPEANYQPVFRQDGGYFENNHGQSFQSNSYQSFESYAPPDILPNFRQDDRER